MGHSSVAVAAANFTFLASGIHRLVDRRDKRLIILEDMLKMNPQCQKRLHLKFKTGKKIYSYLFNLFIFTRNF